MLVECDEILVPTELWERVRNGELNARKELREMLKDMVLYVHALSYPVPHVRTTAREVCSMLNDNLTLTIGFDGPC